jgi:hypothetical protein
MAMGAWISAAAVLAGVNVVLLLALTGVWVDNYRQFRTGMVAGLVGFGAVMLVENAAALYYFFSMQMLYSGDPGVQQAVAVLRGLQAVALAVLTYVTVR